MKTWYAWATPSGPVRLIEGDKMPPEPIQTNGWGGKDYRENAFNNSQKFHYEQALQAAKESSVPIQDQERATAIIYTSGQPDIPHTSIKPDTIYGPFTVEYRIECLVHGSTMCEMCEKVAILLPEKKEQMNDLCAHCNVPIDLHGTCCGWRNAKHPCTPHGIISDQRHPGFGQHFQLYINGTVFGDEDSYEITEATSFRSGWNLCQKEIGKVVPEKEPQEDQDVWNDAQLSIKSKLATYSNDLVCDLARWAIEALKEGGFTITRKQ